MTGRSSNRYGPWEVIKVIGEGANAKVWSATRDDGSEAAVKVLKARRPATEPYKRFIREIQLLKKIGTMPGILPLIDSNLPEHPSKEDPAWLAMPIADNLKTALGMHPRLEQVVGALGDVADTLAALHEKRISHRDIKPENLYWYKKRAAIGDFGLVDFPGKIALTEPGKSLGPRNFLAPEMLNNSDTADGCPADVYSLAKTLWVIATGQTWPPPGEQRLDTTGVLVSSYVSHPKAYLLDRLIERATWIDPGVRLTMREVADELRAWLMPSPQIQEAINLRELGKRVQVATAPAARALRQEQRRRQLFDEVLKRMSQGLSTVTPLIEQTNATVGRPQDDLWVDPHLPKQMNVEQPRHRNSTIHVGYPGTRGLFISLCVELYADERILLYAMSRSNPGSTAETVQIFWRSTGKKARLGSATELQAIEDLIAELTAVLPKVLEDFVNKFVLG